MNIISLCFACVTIRQLMAVMHVCLFLYRNVCMCVVSSTEMYACVSFPLQKCMHVCLFLYRNVCMCVVSSTEMYACVSFPLQKCMHVCLFLYRNVCMCVFSSTEMYACMCIVSSTEMSSSIEFHLEAIIDNRPLQLALKQLLTEDKIPCIKEILEYVRKLKAKILGMHREFDLKALRLCYDYH